MVRKAVHRMPQWFFAHFVLATSHVALKEIEQAKPVVRACNEILPDLAISDIERVPLKNPAQMNAFRAHRRVAGFTEMRET